MKQQFKDYFSHQAESYKKYRPTYPVSLYQYLVSLVPSRQIAWDCATGNGQCAQGLSPYFDKIIASDASQQQIAQARPVNNIEYRCMLAEHTSIDDHSLDLITVAQALHWFDIAAFFTEARRVLKNKGIISVWSYSLLRIDKDINQIIDFLYYDVLNGFWPDERKWVENAYRGIDFPFEELPAKTFSITLNWSLQQLLAYLATWSAVFKYKEVKGQDPLEQIHDQLARLWANNTFERSLSWPLVLRTGRFEY